MLKERRRLTDFDTYPEGMLIYMRNYGPHFNKKLYEFAVSKMTKKDASGNEVPVKSYTREEVETILKNYGVTLKNNQLYDFVYVAAMCKADFLGSSIPNEQYLALYVKNVVEDIDAPDGLIFNRFYADCSYKGIAIDWDEML